MRRRALAARVKLVAAVLLLAALATAIFLTSTPERSPARTWTTWAWQARYTVKAVGGHAELAALHAGASVASREQCVACHGDKTDSRLLVHRIHLRSELLPNLACNECHKRVQIGRKKKHTTAAHWVDVGFCKKCHSAYPGLDPDSHMQSEDLNADCTMCHTGVRAVKHAQSFLPQIMPTSECRGCHGGRVLPWTARHEQDDWLQTHGTEALDAGTKTCFACHNFGLKFCDECHREKPPSHLPAQNWRVIHPDEARADTRVCYTCHETDFCRGCHVNHEAGWMKTHPSFVRARGESSCSECHSPSACSYCHTNETL
ncbi:MAG: hypothetical protein HY876_02290 [Coriobacteriales bacterium]|nr:hypothetical protein [Coriobacteriales bacterium]